METKHTPGPWVSTESQPGIYWVDVVGGGGYGQIATAWGDEAGANARLIAAAPELLEALELALHELKGCYDVTDYPGGANSSQGKAIPVLQAAIAIARGEA